jgi:trans-aconitate methyltransferase
MVEPIYHLPQEYDLEHAGPQPDVEFYVRLAQEWHPRRILELGCGTGRVTLPLTERSGGSLEEVVGLDLVPEMLEAARQKAGGARNPASTQLRWVKGDLRSWRDSAPFDLIIAPCGTLSHLLSVEDQLSTWTTACLNLKPGGRFLADVPMAELPTLAESMQCPPRATLELDSDTSDTVSGVEQRLLRYKAVRYDAREQCASVHFLYDKFQSQESHRLLSDYQQHVYYPRELELLFRMTGFRMEALWGDYHRSPLRSGSRVLLMVGTKVQEHTGCSQPAQ